MRYFIVLFVTSLILGMNACAVGENSGALNLNAAISNDSELGNNPGNQSTGIFGGPPVADLTVNGVKSVSIINSTLLIFKWTAQHADQVFFESNIHNCSYYLGTIHAPFGNSHGYLQGTRFSGHYVTYFACYNKGTEDWVITFKARQSTTGLEASSTITIHMNDFRQSSLWDIGPVYINRSQSLSATFQVSIGSQSQLDLVLMNVPEGITATLTNLSFQNSSGAGGGRTTANLNVTIAPHVTAGIYKARMLGVPLLDRDYQDFVVFVTDDGIQSMDVPNCNSASQTCAGIPY